MTIGRLQTTMPAVRILKISHHYPAYLKHLERRLLPFDGSYQALLERVLSDGFSWADFYKDAFESMGHECTEIIHNFEPLQAKYAAEHSLQKSGLALLSEQIKTYKPDILFLDTLDVTPEWIREIRASVKSIRKIGIFNCSPTPTTVYDLFKECDFVITCNAFIHQQYLEKGYPSFHIFHGFGEKLLKKLKQHETKKQILFSGSLFAGSDFHDERTKVLEGFLKQQIPLTVYAYLNHSPEWKHQLRKYAYRASKISKALPGNPLGRISKFKNLQNAKEAPAQLKLSKALRSKLHDPLFGLDMYQAMKDSLVTFNIHGGIAGRFAANMRLFEATGVGSCLLTDYKDDLKDLFDLDNEVVVYKSKEECIEKANWLIQNPEKAKAIGEAGQKRALSAHTYQHRAEQMIRIFEL